MELLAGTGGIGRATAERFTEAGAKVVIAEINSETGAAATRARDRLLVTGIEPASEFLDHLKERA